MMRSATYSLLSAFWAAAAFAQVDIRDPRAEPYMNVGVTQKLNAQVPMDLVLVNDRYEKKTVAEFIDGKPTILAMVYYGCPMLCGEILNGLVNSMVANEKLECGKDYNVLVVSFHPEETHVLAAENKAEFLEKYGRKMEIDGCHFTVAEGEVSRQIGDAVGYGYKYVEETGEYSHGSSLMMLTPEGRVARYLPGVVYPQREFHLSLVEASEGKIGSLSDKIFLRCFQYDPETRKYSALVMSTVRYACLATVGVFGSFIFVLFRRDLKSHKSLTQEDADTTGGS